MLQSVRIRLGQRSKAKLFLNHLLKFSWLLDGSVRNIFPSSFYCSILIRCFVFIASAKIQKLGEHLAIQLLLARLLTTSVTPINIVDEFQFLFLLFIPVRSTQQRAGSRNLGCVECSFVND